MGNTHEIQIKDSRGKIRIVSKIDSFGKFRVRVWHTLPNKRSETISYTIATESEKLQAMTELWEKMKPTEIAYF